jgi:hypothetical protein
MPPRPWTVRVAGLRAPATSGNTTWRVCALHSVTVSRGKLFVLDRWHRDSSGHCDGQSVWHADVATCMASKKQHDVRHTYITRTSDGRMQVSLLSCQGDEKKKARPDP